MKIEKEELGEKMYDAFMFLAIIALIACLCFADKPHTDTITEKRVTVTVQDKFSEMDTMPEDEYRKIANQYSEGNQIKTRKIAEIAEYFHVDLTAACHRGEKLGIIQSVI